jgi:hypothetical protein
MIKRAKPPLGAVPLVVVLAVLTGLCAGLIIYRQVAVKNPPQSTPIPGLAGHEVNRPSAKRSEIEVKEWGVKLMVPAGYAGNLYYELSNLDIGTNASGGNQPVGDVSFSFKSIATDYPTCAPQYRRVALLRRALVGQAYEPFPPEQFTVKAIKRLGNFDYSYILPRQACIEGSFPYHEQHRQLYDQFRAGFPDLVETLEPVRA